MILNIVTFIVVSVAPITGNTESQWKKDISLQNSIFHSPTSVTYQRSVLACVVRCLETVTGCYLVTYNSGDGSCRAHAYGVNTAIYTLTPHTSVRARDINEVLADMCKPYTFSTYDDQHICFRVVQSKMTYANADVYCRGEGGHLVILNHMAKQSALEIAYPFTSLETFWIGLDELVTEGVWTWINGNPLAFKNWFPGEPNNHNGLDEDCAIFRIETYKWYDYPCAEEHMFICEKDV